GSGTGDVNGIRVQLESGAGTSAGTYHVHGTVDRVDSDGVAIVTVVPGSLFLPVIIPDSLRLSAGDHVEFTIHGLVLWDEDY
nr:hypothetical protein [Candidatus Sigynarchaeota archaeon]